MGWYSLIKCHTIITNNSTSILDNFNTNLNTGSLTYSINYEIKTTNLYFLI